MIILYSKDGLTQKAEIHKFTYNGTFIGECFISATINSDEPINFADGDYCMYRGEKFILSYDPAKEKQARRGTYGEAFIYDNIKFNSLADELTRVEFIDIVLNDNSVHYTSLPNFSFYASSVQDLADRIQANLNRVYTGSQAWTVKVSPDFVSPDKNISVSNINVAEALQLANKEFGANYIIRGRTITIGTAGMAVGKVFGYRKGNGLYDIQQTTNQDAAIITRLRAYGSTRNIPYRYYNNLTDGSGNPFIDKSLYIPNLMLPDFPRLQANPSNVYVDSPNISRYGVREGSIYFDQEDNEIYPSIEGMTAKHLQNAGMNVSLPSGDNGIINELLGAKNPTDNGEIPEEGKGKIDAQFVLYLKDLGFDLSEKDKKGQYKYATTDTMQISMKSGMCVGRTFDIVENGITKDTSKGYTRYKIELNRFTDDSISVAFPNSNYQIAAGDKFVILGISLPEVYIQAASQRLLAAAQEYLSQNDDTKYTYTPEIDEIFMANHPELGETIKEGDILNFTDTDLNIDASVIIQTLKINEGDKLIPTYEVTLSNDRIAGTIEKMQNAINTLVSNQTGITLEQVKTLINSIGSSLFISKRFDDIAQGLIKFVRGLNVGDFASGALGSGGTFRMNEGNSYLEVDQLFVRKWAKFTELIIERLSHIGGSLIISPARMVCSRVEELEDVYRCYFEKGDNNEFVQEFVVGDQARCQVFNGSTQKYYWRLVTAIGDNWIALSKTDMDAGSGIPDVGDHIVQLGNRTNKERQNAQILSSHGADAPSYKQYQGIDSYSLEGKEKTVISPEGNRFEGVMTIEAGSTGWKNIEGLPEEFQSLSTGAVNLLRNSGFTGDYESKRLLPDTKLTANTRLFSENLAHWSGTASVNKDADSKSGYSVTLTDQNLSQTVAIIKDENYIVSLRAKGQSLKVEMGGESETISLTPDYKRYILRFKPINGNVFSLSGRATVCEPQLERGKIVSDWSASPLDNNKTLAHFQALRYITDAVKNGSTSILGGLILSSMIQLGNYIDGRLKKVTAVISGIYNDDNDVAFAAGGGLEKAIYTAMNPKETDPDKFINFVVTHGGMLIANNAVIRGHIDAGSGRIGGFDIVDNKLMSVSKNSDGEPNIILDGMGGTAKIKGQFECNGDNGVVTSINPKDGAVLTIDKPVISQWSAFKSQGTVQSYINLSAYQISDPSHSHQSSLTGFGLSLHGVYGRLGLDINPQNNNEYRLFIVHNNGSKLEATTSDSGLEVVLAGLPKSKEGLPSGTLWLDGELLKVVP